MSTTVKPAPLTAQEKQEALYRAFIQKRESIAQGVLFNLLHGVNYQVDDLFIASAAETAVKLADALLENLYPPTKE